MFVKTKNILLILVVTLFFAGCASLQQTGKKVEVIEARSQISSAQAEPNNIVLMLPLKGPLAASSQAIRNGFLAAYSYARKERPSINIKVIDTAGGDVQSLYQQVVAEGAEVIVGPLTKKEVEAVASINPLPIPTLALNTLDDYTHSFGPNLYQFGLLPQDEAMQIAIRMAHEQHDRVAIIAPEGMWGEKIVTAFKSKYEESGGQVVATLNYRNSQNLAEQICPFLAYDATKLCIVKKNRDRKKEVSDEPMRRQDINAIFLVAQAPTARQIVPLLKFYYASDLPVFSPSSIYSGTVAQDLDRDLDDVYFCDMPWALQDPSTLNSESQAIHKQIMSLWAGSYASHKKLYALGVDAYNLASKLNGFLNSPQGGMEGVSGKLYLNEFNHVYRELQWAQMRDGLPVVLP
jgi:uncharacterized protein